MNNCKGNNDNSVAGILRVILALQQNACPETCLDTCDRPMLGGGPTCIVCNTRPVMLYTCCGNGQPWSMLKSDEMYKYENNAGNLYFKYKKSIS